MITVDEFNNRALMVPFIKHGRDYTGWDCWGLIYCAYRDVFADPLPSYATADSSEAEWLVDAERAADWTEVSGSPAVGDVGLYRVAQHGTHVALVVPGSRMLHSEHGLGTVSERLTTPIWAKRNVGYFRRTRR